MRVSFLCRSLVEKSNKNEEEKEGGGKEGGLRFVAKGDTRWEERREQERQMTKVGGHPSPRLVDSIQLLFQCRAYSRNELTDCSTWKKMKKTKMKADTPGGGGREKQNKEVCLSLVSTRTTE